MSDPVSIFVPKFLKALPLWMLTAAVLSSLAVWWAALFLALFPPEIQTSALGALIVSGIFAACKAVSDVLEEQRHAASRRRRKLIQLYRPLYALFITRHITSSCSAPRVHDRIENARDLLHAYRFRRKAWKKSVLALWDTQCSTTAEIEYGGSFPLDEILQLARRHPAHADKDLLDHIAAARRSRFEDRPTGDLTEAEYRLFLYIERMHNRLARRFD